MLTPPGTNLLPAVLAQIADRSDFPMMMVLILGGVPIALCWCFAILRCGLRPSAGRAVRVVGAGLLLVVAARGAGEMEETVALGAMALGVPICWGLAIYLALCPAKQSSPAG